MPEELPLGALTDRTPNGIALGIGRLISTGVLSPGEKLPTVRAVARQLKVSPTTISDTWRILQRHGAIATDGRRGTFVRGHRQAAAGRYWQVPVDPGTFAVDLSTGTPDPALLPPLGPILQRVQLDLPVTSYLESPVVARLETELRTSWPFEAELITIVDGAQDGLDRLVHALVGVGDTVIVNNPAFPPLLDMLDAAGAQVIGVGLDSEGVLPDELEAALDNDVVAVFLQPRSHNPTGVSMSQLRAAALAEVLSNSTAIIIEDDHSGAVSGSPLASVGSHLPDRVVHVRSFSKSHGPDLRLAAMGGAAAPIDTVVRRRRMGPSWTSRLLQHVLLAMLLDAETQKLVTNAEREYAHRRKRFVDELALAGVGVGGSSGLNLWVPVEDERDALVALAAYGVGAAPGTPFHIGPAQQHHIRLSIGTVTEKVDELAQLVARAAKGSRQ